MSHHLSCISVYATDAERFAEHHTGIIHEILGGEIVCPINDKIIVADDVQCIVLAQEKRYLCGLHIRVQGLYLLCSRPHLLCTHIRGVMYHLPLQIVERHVVSVEQSEMPHACRSEILCNWRTQSAQSHYEHLGFQEPTLSLLSESIEYQMSVIAAALLWSHILMCHLSLP